MVVREVVHEVAHDAADDHARHQLHRPNAMEEKAWVMARSHLRAALEQHRVVSFVLLVVAQYLWSEE